MRVEYRVKWAVLLLVLFAGGCATLGKGGANGFDLAGISKGIEKPPVREGALDNSQESNQDISQGEDPAKAQPVRDLATLIEGGNPYLKKLPASIATPAEEKVLSGDGVLLNFDNADIYEVVQVIAELLDLSFIIDPQVKGMVNIRSGRKIPMSQLYAVFKKLLNINGLDIRSEGNYNYVYKVGQPSAQEVFGPEKAGDLSDSPRMVIQIIPVMHLPAAEAKKLLDPYKSEQGAIDVLDNPNTLFISDYESKVVDMLMILAKVDISPLATFKVRMVRVNRAPLFGLRDELTEIMTALKVNKQGYEGVSIIALERVNSLLLLSGNQELLESATRWVQELDVIPSEGRDNIFIYNVRNSVASELATLVNNLISDQPGTVARPQPTPAPAAAPATNTPNAGAQRPAPAVTPVSQPAPAVRKTGKSAAGGGAEDGGPGLRFAGQPTLIADDSRNIILLRALPADYTRLVKLLERLDNMPRQVLIEVMVAEVSLSDSWEMGIEWALHKYGKIDGRTYDNHFTSNSSFIDNGTSAAPKLHSDLLNTGTGFTYSVLNSAGELAGVLNAIADNNDLSILSSPQVMVLNNETATVNVGEQVPIVTSQTGDLSATVSTSVNQTIQYKDTGVILKVTPKINYDGIIILSIDQQVSSASENKLGGSSSPKISNRQLSTKLAVRDGQTIFMGGLISNNVNYVNSGIPLLMDIPLLGWLFKYQQEKKDKKELLVMITPYVIESEDVLGQYVKSFNEKMDGFRKRLNGGERKGNASTVD
jgi:general secretion pathway protein D